MTFPEENNLEVWKTIPGFEDYSVSTKGQVRRDTPGPGTYPGKIMKPSISQKGYLQIKLKKKIKRIHRLVAISFLPNPDNLPEVDHIDENKKNNNVNNIEWVTPCENIRRSYRTGSRDHMIAENSPSNVLTEIQVLEIKKLLEKEEFSQRKLAKKFGVHHSTIRKIINGKSWAHVIPPTES